MLEALYDIKASEFLIDEKKSLPNRVPAYYVYHSRDSASYHSNVMKSFVVEIM